jgi:hypothetical protein
VVIDGGTELGDGGRIVSGVGRKREDMATGLLRMDREGSREVLLDHVWDELW